tara:strand:+ start:70 stop:918 length:849 start_codon:yes stop_codon:yes gene_type:complete
MDAFRNFNQSGLEGLDAAREAANEKLDAITNIDTRNDVIAKTVGKMKIVAGLSGIGSKVSKVLGQVSPKAKAAAEKLFEEKANQLKGAVQNKVGQAAEKLGLKTGGKAGEGLAEDAAETALPDVIATPIAGATAGAAEEAAGAAADLSRVGSAAGFIAKGGTALPDVIAKPIASAVEGAAEGGAEGAGESALEGVGGNLAKVVATKAAGAIAKGVGEEAGGEAVGGVLDAIPGADIIGLLVGVVTTAIAAHKAHVAMKKQQGEQSPAINTNETFQAGVGTDE